MTIKYLIYISFSKIETKRTFEVKMTIGIIGTSVWQQNLPLIEKLTIDRDIRDTEIQNLKEKLNLTELIYLATCNRVEFIYVRNDQNNSKNPLHCLLDFFFSKGHDISFFPNDFYHYTGKEAVSHLYRTVSSLESLVIGETQITGQFTDAWIWSKEVGFSGPLLDRLAKDALRVAKRVRRETNIGQGAVSMASLAMNALLSKIDKNHKPCIAITGSGPMTVKCAQYLQKNISCDLLFVNRTVSKAEGLAERFKGKIASLESFIHDPGKVDAIISATAARDIIFDAEFLKRLFLSNKHVVCIDLAIPRDFSDEFADSEMISLIDIDELRACEQKNIRHRFVKVSRANEIVAEEVEKDYANRIEIVLKPIFNQSYQESLAMAENAFSDLFEKQVTTLNENDRKAVMNLVTKLLGHSSFQPAKMLSDHLADRAELLLAEDVVASIRESA